MTARKSNFHTADVDLSVSKINRLLRPLRNKCAILASATSRPSGSTAPITYGSTSLPLQEARAPPPLDVMHDPKLVISHAHQESRSLDALARQIYAVTNAFRNIVQAALPGGLGQSRRGLLDLTDICAASVGRSIKGEVARCLAALEGEPDKAEETTLVDELYESVPVRYRRCVSCPSIAAWMDCHLIAHSWTLISHATSEIIEICPNHPMLMLSLLGVALTHGLYAESKIFLRSFLTSLIRSPRHGIPPPITHPMHPSYLVELCKEWTRLAPESCAGLFTSQCFATVTSEVLGEHGSASAWTCKSITRLVQLLRTRDLECFLTFLHGLIEALAVRPKYLFLGREKDGSLLGRVAKWTGVITTDFFSVGGDRECVDTAAHSRQFYTIVEILASASNSELHLHTVYDDNTDIRDPQAALVCAATHCVASPLFNTTSSPHRHAILTLLRDIAAPRSTIFEAVSHRPLAHLRVLASALRGHALGGLERALWASALELSSLSSPAGADPALRAALADAARWGRREANMDMSMNTAEPEAGRERTSRAASTRSPPRKRARRETGSWRALQQRLPSPSPSSLSLSTSISVASTPSLSSSTTSSSCSSISSVRSVSESLVPRKIAVASEDDDMARGSRVGLRSSCGNLKSVLADALRTRKDLKAERRRASLRPRCRHGCWTWSERGYSCEDAEASALPSEGDVLDMFAYDDLF